jgi:hypothetical protein
MVLAQDEIFKDASRSADAAFAALSQDAIRTMHENFILASGGKVRMRRNEKKDAEKRNGTSFTEVRKTHPGAYLRWDEEEENRLRELFKSGRSVREISRVLGRKEGGIRSRLKKLGLTE